jgi:hypothetical protein
MFISPKLFTPVHLFAFYILIAQFIPDNLHPARGLTEVETKL